MVAFDQQMAELQDLLRKADVLASWDRSVTYEIPGETRIEFSASVQIRNDAHARPVGAIFGNANLELDLAVGPARDCLSVTDCGAQVVIEGLTAASEDLRFAMHFDRHGAAEATDLHSLYHWQLGGHRLDGLAISGVLVLEAPRFPWHPLDPILLVDFVLGHFHGEKRAELMSEPEFVRYRRLLIASQTAFVAPFFREVALALAQDPPVDTPFWPSICCE